ncbi:MAG TPA: DNA-3-methyladenine glycosylase [Gemmatimonadales bacterium]|nr:DNA-3-methyladenine glycosylase [Gemmatimonadales bacterium]
MGPGIIRSTERAGRPLPVLFFQRPAEVVARELIGALVEVRTGRTTIRGRIVETEAYLGVDDPASHAFAHRHHAGNASLYSPPGTWYVYRSYGIHWCANLTAGGRPVAAAVLLRALEPLDGLGLMRRRRGNGVPDRALANGPGKLCQAFGIDHRLDGSPMRRSWARLLAGTGENEVEATTRIGITKAVDWPLRFVAVGTLWASRRTARRSS